MTVYPAIDLRGGRQVGLIGGDLERKRLYGDASAFARARAAEGFRALHVVDLDGAGVGRPVQLDTLREIRAAAPGLLIEAGGGVRTAADAQAVRMAGADRVVVGTAAVRALVDGDASQDASSLIAEMRAALGEDGLAVALDGGGRHVALDAWRDKAVVDMQNLGERLFAIGVRWVVHTDTERDGSLEGMRTEVVARLAGTGLRVIAGGGASSDADIAHLASAGAAAVVVGRAFHAGGWRPSPGGVATGASA